MTGTESGDPPVPILLYHALGDGAPGAAADRFAVSPEMFGAHLEQLRAGNWSTITVSELAALLAAGFTPPARTVLLTFDDGYADFRSVALPLLCAFGMSATLYVTTGWVDGEHEGRRMLRWSELADCRDGPVEIGAHSHTHPELDVAPVPRMLAEVRRSKLVLEDRLGVRVDSFAYPHGYHSGVVRDAVRSAGFTSACAVKNALSHPRDDVLALARVTMTADTGPDALAAILAGEGPPRSWRGERLRTRGWRQARRLRSAVRGHERRASARHG